MPALAPRLTAPRVDSFKPQNKRREYSDGGSGLALVIQPSGLRTWTVRTRYQGDHKRVTLGSYPALSLANARDAARAVLERADAGEAPVKPEATPAPSLSPAGDTVAKVWADHLRLHLEPNSKPRSVKKAHSAMKPVLPLWADRPFAEISRRDVIDVTDAAAFRGKEARNTLIGVLNAFFSWGEQRDLIAVSPVRVKKTEYIPRKRVLTDEIKTIWQAAEEMGPIFGPFVQLLLLTGARRDEVAGMRWDEINGDTWTIPEERAKTDQPLDVHLTDLALAALATMPRIRGSPFVFTTSGRAPVSGFSKAKVILDNLAPIKDWTFHDLRRTFATGLGGLGIVWTTIERCLNHAVPGVAGVYNRYAYNKETAAAWKLWADHVSSIVKSCRDD